jgi:hypothetical protein
MDLEGGVYVLRGDDGRSYDLHGVEAFLSAELKIDHEGVRVVVEGRLRGNLVDFHMVGPIIEVTALRLLKD